MDEQRLAEMITVARAQSKKVASGRYSRSPIPGTCHEDCTQETMISMIKYLRKSLAEGCQTKIEDFLGYVSRATVNEYFTMRRKAYCYREFGLFDSTEETTEERAEAPEESTPNRLICRKLSPAERIVYREALERVWDRLCGLPQTHFAVFVLLQRDELCGDDVASLILEVGLCSSSELARKCGITEAKLAVLLKIERRTVAEVGALLGIAPATTSNKRNEAERFIRSQPQRPGRTALGSGRAVAKRVRAYT